HKQIVLRWGAKASDRKRRQILKAQGLEKVGDSPFAADQVVVRSQDRQRAGADLVEVVNKLMELDQDEVVFAVPNFVSQFVRSAVPAIHREQWHLKNTAAASGEVANEDLKAEGAWKITRGKRAVVVAVLDDGVDVDHKNLRANILKNPDGAEPRDK